MGKKKKEETIYVDSYLRFDCDICNDMPEKGYYTAFVWGSKGVARTVQKAVAFALENVAKEVKNGIHDEYFAEKT